MPHDLPEPSPLTRTGAGAGVGSSTATATSGTSMSMSMGPSHSAIVLSDPQPGLVESRSSSPSVIAESYERTRSAVTAAGTGTSSSSGVAQRTPWVSWNGYAINPYDHRGGGSQVMDLRTGRRAGTTNSPTRRALVEHYITYRRDTHPNDPSTSLGRSVEGRTSSGSGSTSQETTGSGSNDTALNFEGLNTDIESVITRLNRYSDELSIASGGFRRGLGSLDFLTGEPLQPEPPRGLSDQVVSSSRPASRPDMNGQISGSGSVETQRSAWRTVNPPPQDPQRVPMGIATRFRARPRPGLAFPHPPPSSAPSQPPSAGPSLTSTSMTNISRGERTSRPTRFHSRFPVVTISDNENYNDDSEDELEPFSFWLGRVRREEPNRVRTNLQALAPPPASGTGMNTIPPPESLTNALRERLDRLRQSFGGVAGAEVLAQRTTISGLGDGLTNGRRRRRGWARLDQDGNEIPTDEEEEYERNRSNMRARAQALSSYYGRQYAREGSNNLAPTHRQDGNERSFTSVPMPPSSPPLTFSSTTQTRLSLDDPERSARVRLNSSTRFFPEGDNGSRSISPTVILSDSESSSAAYFESGREGSGGAEKTSESEPAFFGCSTPFEVSPLPVPLVRTEGSGVSGGGGKRGAGRRRYIRVSAQGPRAGR